MALPNIIQQINSKLSLSGGTIKGGNLIIEGGYNSLQLKTSSNEVYSDIAFIHSNNIRKGFIRSTVKPETQEIAIQSVDVVDNTTKYYSSLTVGYNHMTSTPFVKANGYDIITSAGGYITGNLTWEHGIIRDQGNNFEFIGDKDNTNNCAFISCRSVYNSKEPGWFYFGAGTQEQSSIGVCKPDGTFTWNGNNVITQSNLNLCLPNYSAGILVGTCTSAQVITYTAPKDGIISIDLLIHNGNSYLKINGIDIISNTVPNTSYINNNTCFYPVTKGDTIQVYTKYTSTSYCSQKIYFYPFKGAK